MGKRKLRNTLLVVDPDLGMTAYGRRIPNVNTTITLVSNDVERF